MIVRLMHVPSLPLSGKEATQEVFVIIFSEYKPSLLNEPDRIVESSVRYVAREEKSRAVARRPATQKLARIDRYMEILQFS